MQNKVYFESNMYQPTLMKYSLLSCEQILTGVAPVRSEAEEATDPRRFQLDKRVKFYSRVYNSKSQMKKSRIAPSEWQIMEVLWKESPLSASEIFQQMPADVNYSVKANRSFLDRLIQKKSVTKQKMHGIYIFSPNIKRSEYVSMEVESFIKTYFFNRSECLVIFLLENNYASLEGIKDLMLSQSSPHR